MAAPFTIIPELTAITIAYRNNKLIADDVLPRIPVGKEQFMYNKYTLSDSFTIPDTKVGRKSKPNEIEFSATETPASTYDFGLDDTIPETDIKNAPENYDPKGRAVEGLTDIIALDREVRTANIMFNQASYASGNTMTLSGTSQFSDYANSDPIGIITEALDSVLMRPNKMVIGRAAFSKLASHPKIVSAAQANAGQSGIASRKRIADIFELDDIFVGEGWVNTARKNQQPNMQRVWGKHISLIYLSAVADTRMGTTFGYTAQFGSRVAGEILDGDVGLRGGVRIRVGEGVGEIIAAPDLGFFIQNAVA